MYELTKEIVIAMINNGYIRKGTTDENIKDVNKALEEIHKQLLKLREQ